MSATSANSEWRALFHTYQEFQNAPPLRFAIEGFLQEDGITLIGALAGHGKTMIMLAMVWALLGGMPLFNWDAFAVPRPSSRVLYLIPECGIGPFWARLKLFHLEEHIRSERLFVSTLSAKEQVPLTDCRILKAAEGADIFLDTAIRFMNGEENAESSRAFAQTLFALQAAGARTITGAHHAPKGFEKEERMTLENILRGSGDIGAMLSCAWGMRQIDADSNRIYVQNVKARDFQPCDPFVLEGRPYLDETGNFLMLQAPGIALDMSEYMPRKGGAPGTPGREQKRKLAVMMKAAGKSLSEIAEVLGVSKSCVGKWLKEVATVDAD